MPTQKTDRPTPTDKDRRLVRFLLPVLVFVAAVPDVCAQKTPSASEIEVVNWQIGFDGQFKLGHWTEAKCQVDLSGLESGQENLRLKLRATSPDPLGNRVRFESKVFELSEGGKHHVSALLQVGKPNAVVDLALLVENDDDEFKEIASRSISQSNGQLEPLELGERLFVSLGECIAARSFETLRNDSTSLASVRTVEVEASSDFPTNWRSFSSADCVFLSDVSELSDQQSLALRDWVLSGGRVVVSLGRHAEAFRTHPISKWFPVTLGEGVQLRELTGIESYVGRADRIPSQRGVPSVFLPEDQGVPLAKSLSGPLILRHSYGLGRVTVIGVNINDAPFVTLESAPNEDEKDTREENIWRSLPLLCWQLCEFGKVDSKSQILNSAQLTQAGIGDFKTQLIAANDARFDVQRPSIWVTLGILILYLVVIGPADYLLVHKVIRKPEWTWYTFPVLAIFACILLASVSTSWNGTGMQVGTTSIVDYDAETGLKFSREYISLYSSESRRYDLSFSKTAASDFKACWTGVPESGVAGMYRATGFNFGVPNYEIKQGDENETIFGLPTPIWSSTHWANTNLEFAKERADNPAIPFIAELSATASGQLRGTIQHQFQGNLVNWLLAYGNRVYHPDSASEGAQSIPPRQRWSLANPLIRQRELKGYLTGSRAMSVKRKRGVGEDVVILQDDYDPLSTDITTITRFLTFYDKVGGYDYTRLSNTELGRLDLSSLLDLNRAVFIAEVDSEKRKTTNIDGGDVEPVGSSQIIRIVIPIERKQQDIKVLPKFDDE